MAYTSVEEDDRVKQAKADLDAEKNEKVNAYNETQDQLMNDYNDIMAQQQNNINVWADTQKQNQQAQTDFQIEQINQQKEQTEKDYTKEQKGAYSDYMKESNQYGVNAEQMASVGLNNTGYSESSKVSMYNTYQNRVATARESLQRAQLEYENMIQKAILDNNVALAEISYQQLQQSTALALEGFNYKSTIINNKLAYEQQMDETYYGRYKDTLAQINYENQFEYQKQKDAQEQANWEKQYELSKQKALDTSTKKKKKKDDGDEDIDDTPTDLKETGRTAGGLLTAYVCKQLGIPTDSKVYVSGNNYYIKVGDDYIDVTAQVNKSKTRTSYVREGGKVEHTIN